MRDYDFVHLRVRSVYSLLDSSCRIGALAERAAGLGQPALALTDRCVMSGVWELHKACERHAIRPIYGCELNVVDDHAHMGLEPPPGSLLV